MRPHSLEFLLLTTDQFPLLRLFYQQEKQKLRLVEKDHYCVLLDKEKILAALRLEKISAPQGYILRNVLVAKSHQRKGLALQLIQHSLDKITGINCYCFAYDHLLCLYQQAGFMPITIQQQAQLTPRYLRYQKHSVVLMQRSGSEIKT